MSKLQVQRTGTSPGACKQFKQRDGKALLIEKGTPRDVDEDLAHELVEDYPEDLELAGGGGGVTTDTAVDPAAVELPPETPVEAVEPAPEVTTPPESEARDNA